MHRSRRPESPEYAAFAEPEREFHSRLRSHLLFHSTHNTAIGEMAAPARRTVADYAKPTVAGNRSSITRPVFVEDNWHIPTQIINLIIHSSKFHGLPEEDPNAHLGQFLRMCDTFKIKGVFDDAVFLRLFPFPLEDKAITWFESLPSGSITTWDEMQELFLTKYFPPAKTARLRSLIHSFQQEEGESFFATWERFKETLNRCPHHGLGDWALVEKFYNGVTFATRHTLDSTAGGNLLTNMTPDECLKLFENMTMSSYQYPTRGKSTATQKTGVLHVDSNTALTTQVEALTKLVKDMQVKNNARCEVCRGGHETIQCPQITDESQEQVDYVGNPNRGPGNAFGNSYNSGGRNQPGFTWKSGNPPGFNSRPPMQNLFREPGQSSGGYGEKKSTLEEMMQQQAQLLTHFITKSKAQHKEHGTMIKSQGAALQNLERQVSQIASQLGETQSGSLPSKTEENPRGYAKAITTRSGRSTGTEKPIVEPVEDEEVMDEKIEMEAPGEVQPTRLAPASTAQPEKTPEKKKDPEIDLSKIPYPVRVLQQKYEKEYGRFLELFK
ncbi:hypothetical protein E3N88_25389 [Mikania micrantha]|uniref:Retrotransposon gag domain-containing protein n=1 Tax=Mikania micrantha TaxID=192012 RepID=A0A5N6N7F0_9ASTR|nr:hypothetical protein E3N88_25389 [Mikania micrantha]